MVFFTQVVAAAAVLSLGAAAPAPASEKRTGKAFTVDMVPKSNPTVKNGASAYLKALRKYNASPELITAVAAAAAASSVTATPSEYDEEYTCPVTIGDQTFELDFDTGSSDLWVLGSSLSSKGNGHTYYTPSSSATRESGETWSISYGDGSSASGTVYSDTVTIGGTTVTGQAVESASKASSEFTASSPEDGLVGLAFDSINTASPNQVSTFFTNAIDQGLPEALFTALLKHNEAGKYTFGELDSSQYSGDITYTDVDDSDGFWTFSPSGYAVGSGSTKSSSALTGIADTGTTLMLLDTSVASAYWGQVSSASYTDETWIFDCDDADSLPDFTLVIEGYEAVVPGEYMNYAPNGDGTCYGGIQPDTSIGFAIYGDVFLKSQFVVFDKTQSTPRLGFAAQA
ncbi:putative aspartic endopeptidase pep1 [Phaeomoniella chlamydospora]|uniref:Putative aspartic endopeptidase pep1 n=1 Tax=Phaeomoniella chlamydospora TaxID=158046 RepID=A0A0G2E5C3_PHACM|nr:putative aspartic endopeptidase pep1 [Phaeomoniella chlamydospora]